ncbi:DNA adenine methyltransferase YhdJ [Roseivivax sp. THAF40]|uniref:site-specific DNA-methyltransferase n=1 Tax=Roseivivax sp. THAF40 TaxID=2587858 RepID=UPI001268420D|nr:DNA methyltransferase [Roseivivax sp. THAF40]QFT47570.1 DNA adenine methyltransferase YhdJ [Roseivivax sp. THAF40]
MSLTYLDVAIGDVRPSARNARTHTPKQIKQIAESIRRFGFTNPVLIDETGTLIAGHGRLEAAKTLGRTTVPTIQVAYLSGPEKRALMLADNKIALNAGWDMKLLAQELEELSAAALDYDIETTGFEAPEIDLIIGSQGAAESEEPEVVPEPQWSGPLITRPGDIWILGEHRILCGDARNPEDYESLMQGERAQVGFTDPPYNVPIAGHVSGKGSVQHREFAEASGEMSSAAFTSFLSEALGLAAAHSCDGAVWFACMDWRHLGEMRAAGLEAFGHWLNLCVWAKTNGGMGSLYRSQHELIFVFRNGGALHRNNVQLGQHGRNRTNVWTYPGVNTFRAGRMEELRAHPTAKPVAMVRDALLDVSRRGDVVLDPFLGAGATVMAAERSGRIARGLEIDPAYVDVILRRWRADTGNDPMRAGDGAAFSGMERAA